MLLEYRPAARYSDVRDVIARNKVRQGLVARGRLSASHCCAGSRMRRRSEKQGHPSMNRESGRRLAPRVSSTAKRTIRGIASASRCAKWVYVAPNISQRGLRGIRRHQRGPYRARRSRTDLNDHSCMWMELAVVVIRPLGANTLRLVGRSTCFSTLSFLSLLALSRIPELLCCLVALA